MVFRVLTSSRVTRTHGGMTHWGVVPSAAVIPRPDPRRHARRPRSNTARSTWARSSHPQSAPPPRQSDAPAAQFRQDRTVGRTSARATTQGEEQTETSGDVIVCACSSLRSLPGQGDGPRPGSVRSRRRASSRTRPYRLCESAPACQEHLQERSRFARMADDVQEKERSGSGEARKERWSQGRQGSLGRSARRSSESDRPESCQRTLET